MIDSLESIFHSIYLYVWTIVLSLSKAFFRRWVWKCSRKSIELLFLSKFYGNIVELFPNETNLIIALINGE